MDLVIPKRDLLRLTAQCQGAVSARAVMPALSGILLSAGEGALSMTATDLYLTIRGRAAAEVKEAGAAVVPARDLLECVKTMPEGHVRVSTAESQPSRVRLAAVGSPRAHTLRSMPASAFPATPEAASGSTARAALSLRADVLTTLIARTQFSAHDDESQPHLSSALLEWAGDRARMVTTDGHRISKMDVPAPPGSPAAAMLVSARAIAEVWRLAREARAGGAGKTDGADGEDATLVVICQTEADASFAFGDVALSAKLVSATPLPYEQVISMAENLGGPAVVVSRALLADSLRAVSRSGNQAVKLSLLRAPGAQGVLRITSDAAESGSSFDELSVEGDVGAGIEAQFNARFFLDVLGAMDEERVSLSLSASSPAVLRPVVSAHGDYVAILAPVAPNG